MLLLRQLTRAASPGAEGWVRQSLLLTLLKGPASVSARLPPNAPSRDHLFLLVMRVSPQALVAGGACGMPALGHPTITLLTVRRGPVAAFTRSLGKRFPGQMVRGRGHEET